jgi:flagellar basal body-associated protein FliL
MKNKVKGTIVLVVYIAILGIFLLVAGFMLVLVFMAGKPMSPELAVVVSILFVIAISTSGHGIGLLLTRINELITQEEKEQEEQEEEEEE